MFVNLSIAFYSLSFCVLNVHCSDKAKDFTIANLDSYFTLCTHTHTHTYDMFATGCAWNLKTDVYVQMRCELLRQTHRFVAFIVVLLMPTNSHQLLCLFFFRTKFLYEYKIDKKATVAVCDKKILPPLYERFERGVENVRTRKIPILKHTC